MSEGRLLVGDVIGGKYRIDGVAGEGGMGIVYEAEHVILRQRVAVKVMLPGSVASREALDRFSLEASAIARIACEHVVRVMDAGTLPNNAPYLVMEYLEGIDLERLLAQRGPLPASQAADFALQALEALAHAHAARVIHRDLKCANLFLVQDRIIKLLDFGLAMPIDLDLGGDPGRIVGSPRYMSPEQLRKDPLDPRTDLWSLGVVMYELVSGSPPFDGQLTEIIGRILGETPAPLEGVPAGFAAVVARCLAKDADDRWPDVAALARALEPFASAAWKSAVDRVERALANVAPPPENRRYETFDAALSALDSRPRRDEVVIVHAQASSLGATIPAPPSEPNAVEEITTPQKLRILMIDDSEFVLGVHAMVLEDAGFEVRATTSPDELLDLVDRWKPHLVLMDVQMPGTTGDDLCRQVKAKHKAKIPVVFVSNLEPSQLGARAKGAGADAFMTKTGDWAAFVAFVRNICAIAYSPEHLP